MVNNFWSTKCSIFLSEAFQSEKIKPNLPDNLDVNCSGLLKCSTACLTIFRKVQGEDALNMKNVFDGYIYFWMDISWRFSSFITFLHLRSLFVSYPGSGRSWLRSMFEVNIFSSCTILLRFIQELVLCLLHSSTELEDRLQIFRCACIYKHCQRHYGPRRWLL